MLPTIQDIGKAVEAMGRPGIVRYFPSDRIAREIIIRDLESMVPSVEALRWLTNAFIRQVGVWTSAKELRGILCSRYTPRDGILAIAETPGFRPEDAPSSPEIPSQEETLRLLSAPREIPDPAVETELAEGVENLRKKIATRKTAIQPRMSDRLAANRLLGGIGYKPPTGEY